MKQKKLLVCAHQCIKDRQPCQASTCRFSIDYEEEYNCSLISIYENGELTLREIAKREGISFDELFDRSCGNENTPANFDVSDLPIFNQFAYPAFRPTGAAG